VIPLPQAEESQNVRALARLEREDVTGIAAATLTLAQNPVEAAAPPGTSVYINVFKNGVLLSNVAAPAYSVAGKVITFNTALIASDVVVVCYYARAS